MKLFYRSIFTLISFILVLTACDNKNNQKNTLKVGTIAGPETSLVIAAKEVAEKNGVNIQVIEFSDYNIPNTALNDGSIDANIFQHDPFLQSAIKAHGYTLVAIGKTFIYPMGIYSKKIKSLSELPDKAIVTIPNDPSNEARALLLLQKANLIKLKNENDINATPQDILENPKQLQIKELDAAQLPRTLADVDIAVINTTFAIPADLLPKRDAIFIEDQSSPYANLIVVREKDQNKPELKKLTEALHSQAVMDKAKELFSDQAIPAW